MDRDVMLMVRWEIEDLPLPDRVRTLIALGGFNPTPDGTDQRTQDDTRREREATIKQVQQLEPDDVSLILMLTALLNCRPDQGQAQHNLDPETPNGLQVETASVV